jgi:hypothetical protein
MLLSRGLYSLWDRKQKNFTDDCDGESAMKRDVYKKLNLGFGPFFADDGHTASS